MQQHGFHLIYQTLKHRRAPNLMTAQSEYYLAAICYATKSVRYLHKKNTPTDRNLIPKYSQVVELQEKSPVHC